MRELLAVSVFVLMACSQSNGTPVARVTSSPSAAASISPAPTRTPPTATPSLPSPIPVQPADHVDFVCRLPVTLSSQSGGNPEHFGGGFISFPDAVFTPDPASGVVIGNDADLMTVATPVLRNDLGSLAGPPFYDQAQRRWVPASSSQATPDGLFYAYTTNDPSTQGISDVHIVDVARGTEKIYRITMPAGMMAFSVADFNAAGVYLLGAFTIEQLPAGVWLMDTTTGSLRQVAQVGLVKAVRNGYAWAAAIDPRDPTPPQLRRSGTPSDSLVRVDLSTGATAVWLYRPGLEVDLIGFDGSGAPVVSVYEPGTTNTRYEIWLVASSAAAGLIYSGPLVFTSPQGDGARLWLSSIDSNGAAALYVYTVAHGLQQVYASSTSQLAIEPAGRCT